MREATSVIIGGSPLVGTIHRSGDTHRKGRNAIGVLLLSFGQQPRSWVGDLGSAVADSIAAQGFTVFRFDMPGLGDSPGDLPVHLEVLWREIQLGAHEQPLHALCEYLERKYALKGLVVGGFCGGAVTALYATNSKSFRLLGLVLLEPEISLADAETGESDVKSDGTLTLGSYLERKEILFQRLRSPSSWKKLLRGKIDFDFWNKLFSHSGRLILRRVRGEPSLPPETNRRTLDAWHIARRRRIPTIVLSVGSPTRSKYYQAYGLKPGVEDRATKLQWLEVPNTTHAMLAGGAKHAVCKHVAEWMNANF